MFDVSALLSLKPTASITDQMTAPGGEALQTGSFSRILSTQLEVPPPVPGEPGSPSPDLAANAQQVGSRQPTGKILPDALPVVPEAPAEAEPGEVAEIKPLDSLLARQVELASTRPAAKPVRSADVPATPSEAAEFGDDDGAPATGPAETVVPPAALLALVQPAALATAPSTPRTAANAAPMPSRMPTQPTAAIGAQADQGIATPTAAASLAPVLTATALPNAAATSGMSHALVTIPQPASAKASPVDPAASMSASTIALVTAQAHEQATPPAEQTAALPADRPATAAKLQNLRADAKPIAGQSDDAAAAPAATSQATERGTPAASVSQPATILPDIRQPVVGPSAAAVAPAAPSETPQDFAALVDRLIAARESAAPQPVQATISHAEFGRISLDFRQDGGALTVAMNSADPGFAPAVAAAVAADKFVLPGSDVQQPNQAQAAAQAQASSQPQNQGQNQNQSQPQSQSQSPGGNSGQLHQEASGQRNADGSGAQGRNGQERSPRYQSDPSQSGRDNGSPRSRKGTYA